MCGDCWNAAMGAPAAVVAARFAWLGYRDRIPFLGRRDVAPEPTEPPPVPETSLVPDPAVEAEREAGTDIGGRELVEAGPPVP